MIKKINLIFIHYFNKIPKHLPGSSSLSWPFLRCFPFFLPFSFSLLWSFKNFSKQISISSTTCWLLLNESNMRKNSIDTVSKNVCITSLLQEANSSLGSLWIWLVDLEILPKREIIFKHVAFNCFWLLSSFLSSLSVSDFSLLVCWSSSSIYLAMNMRVLFELTSFLVKSIPANWSKVSLKNILLKLSLAKYYWINCIYI